MVRSRINVHCVLQLVNFFLCLQFFTRDNNFSSIIRHPQIISISQQDECFLFFRLACSKNIPWWARALMTPRLYKVGPSYCPHLVHSQAIQVVLAMVSTGIPLDTATIISTVLEAILFGEYYNEHSSIPVNLWFFRLFSSHVHGYNVGVDPLQTWRKSPDRFGSNPAVDIKHCSELLTSYPWCHLLNLPQHLIVDIIRLEDGFVKYRDIFPGGPVAFFQDISQPTFVTKNLIYALQTMIGDGVVVCFILIHQLFGLKKCLVR